MSSIFLRIYGGLLFSLVLVSLLSGITVTLVNGLRTMEYRELMVQGTFSLVARELNKLPVDEQAQQLATWRSLLTLPLQLQPAATDEELSAGELILEPLGEHSTTIRYALDGNVQLQAEVDEISEELLIQTAVFLRHLLEQLPPEQRKTALYSDLANHIDITASLEPQRELPLSWQQRQQLKDGYVIVALSDHNQTIQLYAQLKDGDQILRLGPVELLTLYPFKLLFALAVFVLLSLSLAIYIVVRGMERRLRKLERAATRLSRGDFKVRVPTQGTDSIGRLALAFNTMADHIQRLLNLQKEMIQGVSHELRTPVARIRFGLDLLADARDEDERQSQIDGMDKDIEELNKLVDEFLTYANLEQGTPVLNLQKVDVDEVLAQVVAEHMRLQNTISITHVPTNAAKQDRICTVDRRYLHRAVQNLVGNACRYANSKIEVRFTASPTSCQVEVDDDGPGIPKEQWDRVFSAFSRLDDSRTRKSGGYGLGLSIVRRIMYWHSGRASVSHSPLGGARFSLVWPHK